MRPSCPHRGPVPQLLRGAKAVSDLALALLLPLLVVVQVSGLLAACTEKGGGPPPLRFALLVNRLGDVWTKSEIAGFQRACREFGVEALVFDNRMDANTTLSNMDIVLEQGIDGIALSPPDQKISALIVDKAFSAEVPVVSMDLRLLDYNNRQLAPHVGVDNVGAGEAVGRWLAERIRDLRWLEDRSITVGVAALTYDEIWDMKLRTDACRKVLLEELPVLDERRLYGIDYRSMDAVGALLGMQELITSHPDVTNWVVFAGNDEGVIGAVRALEQVGLDENAVGCGIGYGRAMAELSKNASAFKATVFIDGCAQGRLAASHLYEYLVHGRPIPAATHGRIFMVDRAAAGTIALEGQGR